MSLATTFLALQLLFSQYAPQQAGTDPLAPALEERVQQLGKELRCTACQGMSVADSPSSMARAQLDKIRELVAAGKSDAEVRDYFVQRYGEWILLRPTTRGFNSVIWLAPGVVLAVGLLLVVLFVMRNVRTNTAASPSLPVVAPDAPNGAVAAPADPALQPYLDKVRSELSK